jgi:hypothetical protein
MTKSNQAGEAQRAWQGLDRTLRNASPDLIGEIANRLDRGPDMYAHHEMLEMRDLSIQKGIEIGRMQATASNGSHGLHDADDDDDDEDVDWRSVALECSRHPMRMRDQRELKFVQDMVRNTSVGMHPTVKQAKWLRSIYRRVA